MKFLILVTPLLFGFACLPSDYSTPCPVAQQFCVTQTDGGCEVSQLVCCEHNVPPCPGTYTGDLPQGCVSTGLADRCP